MSSWSKVEKWAIILFILIVIVGMFVLFLPKFRNIRELQRRNSALGTENKNIERETKELRLKREKFKTEPKFIESVARESGLVKPDEVIFKFLDSQETETE